MFRATRHHDTGWGVIDTLGSQNSLSRDGFGIFSHSNLPRPSGSVSHVLKIKGERDPYDLLPSNVNTPFKKPMGVSVDYSFS